MHRIIFRIIVHGAHGAHGARGALCAFLCARSGRLRSIAIGTAAWFVGVVGIVGVASTASTVGITTMLLTQPAQAQYRLSVNPMIFTPLEGMADVAVPINPGFTFSMMHYTNRTPISLGGSIGFQYYNFQPARRGRTYSYELLAFPLNIGFQVNLLPDFVINHYYGADAGAMIMRYTRHSPQYQTSLEYLIGVTLAPNAGFRIQIAENLLLDLNVRYQITFHRDINYGPGDEYRLRGFNALGWMIGFSYAVNGGRN
jgi:hypothetical protein